ncbi:hypothetical protein DM860_013019 [Cuscuta australis]|uniref:RIN4 pathogenic type III effector avirulence factor Avr cleavage site domain-containing protein n=1 Tax=Cuscuta australis TaxID=267555 RepID=A0A328D5V6_9ASTE|nr:hypothetical protein DM860_013019 [Cuscuta australis]
MGERNAPLPKFGEWDVKNPAAAREFSVIFDKARNAKRDGVRPPYCTSAARRDQLDSPVRNHNNHNKDARPAGNKAAAATSLNNKTDGGHFVGLGKPAACRKWLCCVGGGGHDD